MTDPIADRKAGEAYRAGRWAEAIGIVRDWQARQPRDPVPWVRWALMESARGDRAAALPLLQKAIDLSHGVARANLAIAACRLALALNDTNQATKLVEVCLRADPNHPLGRRLKIALRSRSACQRGDYRQAISYWQSLSPADRKQWGIVERLPGALVLAARQAAKQGKRDEAIRYLQAAEKAGVALPHREELFRALAAPVESEPPTLARLEQQLAAGGQGPRLVQRLARTYRHYGRPADAHRTLDLLAEDASLDVERGLLALSENQLLLAERFFHQALAGNRDEPTALANLVRVRLSLGRFAEAAELIPRAAEHAASASQRRLFTCLASLADPSSRLPDWSAEDDRAVIALARSLGRLESAEKLIDALVARSPSSAIVQQAEQELLPIRAKRFLDRGEVGRAKALLTAARPMTPTIRNLLGLAAALQQDFAAARRHFEAALPPVGEDARLRQNLAIVKGWSGDGAGAARDWSRYLEILRAQVPDVPSLADYHARIAARIRGLLRPV